MVSSILFALFIGFGGGFLYRAILKRFAKKTPFGRAKNIGLSDRWLRAGLGIAFFVWAYMTDWGFFALVASGFCFFEAIFSWCGLYAAMGKNTCPTP